MTCFLRILIYFSNQVVSQQTPSQNAQIWRSAGDCFDNKIHSHGHKSESTFSLKFAKTRKIRNGRVKHPRLIAPILLLVISKYANYMRPRVEGDLSWLRFYNKLIGLLRTFIEDRKKYVNLHCTICLFFVVNLSVIDKPDSPTTAGEKNVCLT